MKTRTVVIIAALVVTTALASGPTALARETEPLRTPECLADLNADNVVDRADLDRLLSSYGACKGCQEDLNQDNVVDNADVAIIMQQWGPCRPEGDIFRGDDSSDSFVGGSDSLADGADSLADPDIDHTTTTTLLPSRCQGDLNGDTFVDEQDMAQLLRHEGTCLACEEDLNEDGFVDEADAQIIDRQWGPCRPEGDVFGADHSAGSLTGSSDSLSDMEDRVPDRTKRTPEDVNGDSFVDMVDILTVTEHVGQEPIGDKAFSDVNNDGRIDKYDIRAIAVYVITGESIGA